MRKTSIFAIICSLALLLAIPLFAKVPTASAEPAETDWSQLEPGVDYREGEVVVGFTDDATEETAAAVAESCGFTLVDTIDFDAFKGANTALFSLPEGVSVPDAIAILEKDPSVTYAMPNYICYPDAGEATTDWSQLEPGVDYMAGEVIVCFAEDATEETAALVAESHGYTLSKFRSIKLTSKTLVHALFLLPDDVSVPDAIAILEQDPAVTYAYPNIIIRLDDIFVVPFQRLAGSDRYETGAAIADTYGAQGGAVILATGESFPDALCASALAGLAEAPILMTDSDSLSSSTAAVLANVKPDRIAVIGGTGAVSDSVLEAACAAAGIPCDEQHVQRYCGDDRFATSMAICGAGGLLGRGDTFVGTPWIGRGQDVDSVWSDEVCIIATGGDFADALSISPFAYATAIPIFLTDPKTGKLDAATEEALSGHFRYGKVIIVGGTGAVSDEVIGQLDVDPANVVRLAGSNRYETSLAIAKWEMGLDDEAAFGPRHTLGMTNVSLATGTNFPDALTGSVLCGRNNSVLLLVGEKEAEYQGALELVRANAASIEHGYIFGGTGAVSDDLKLRFDAALG